MRWKHNTTTTQPNSPKAPMQHNSPKAPTSTDDGGFLGPVEKGEESGMTRMEEEERNVAHLPPAQAEHACCNYGQPEEPEEDITDVQEGVSVMFRSLLLFFLFI